MTIVYKNNILYVDNEPVIHEGSDGYADMQQLCWVQVGDKRIIKPFTARVYAKDLENLCEDVRVNGHRVATIHSYFKKCYGDEMSEGGVKSGTKGGSSHFITASPNVSHEGMRFVRRGDMIIANNRNSVIGAWQDSPPNAPSFQDKCQSKLISPNDQIETVTLSVQLNPYDTKPNRTLPFHRALSVSTPEQEFIAYAHTTGAIAVDHKITFQLSVPRADKIEVRECLNDPAGDLYSVHQGFGNVNMIVADFKTFSSPENDPAHIQAVFSDTWIYILKDGQPWREMKGNHEINLIKEAGKDIRTSRISTDRGILFNVSDQEGKHEYAYIISPVQFTWQQMQSIPARDAVEMIFGKYPEEPVPDTYLSHESVFNYPHPSVAVVYMKDPVGHARYLADQIIALHDAHMDFLSEHTDLYHSGKLVGDVLQALQEHGEDYRKHVRDTERLEQARLYEETLKIYEMKLAELTDLLKACVEQAESSHAWQQVDLTQTHHLDQLSQDWYRMGMALNQTQIGRECIVQFLKDERSTLNYLLNAVPVVAISSSTKGIAMSLLEMLAIPSASYTEGFQKLIAWVNKVFKGFVDAKIVQTSFDELSKQSRPLSLPIEVDPHHFVLTITPDRRLETLENDTGPYPKKLAQPRLPSQQKTLYHIESVTINGMPVHRIANDLIKHPMLHQIFVILGSANAVSVMRQMDTSDISCQEKYLLIAEFISGIAETLTSIIEISALNIYASQKIGKHKTASFMKLLTRKFSGIGILIYAGTDMYRGLSALKSGSTGLAAGYGAGVASGMFSFTLLFTNAIATTFCLLNIVLLASSLFFGILSVILLTYFYKNEWEEWLYQSPWGASDTRVAKHQDSLLRLFKILQMVYVSDVRYLDSSLRQKIPPKRYEKVIREPIDGSIPVLREIIPSLHQELMRSPILLTIKIVPVPDAVILGFFAKNKAFDILGNPEILAPFRYERFHKTDNDHSHYMTINLPGNILPASGESLKLTLRYLLPHGKEYAMIETRHFQIEYDRLNYVYQTRQVNSI